MMNHNAFPSVVEAALHSLVYTEIAVDFADTANKEGELKIGKQWEYSVMAAHKAVNSAKAVTANDRMVNTRKGALFVAAYDMVFLYAILAREAHAAWRMTADCNNQYLSAKANSSRQGDEAIHFAHSCAAFVRVHDRRGIYRDFKAPYFAVNWS